MEPSVVVYSTCELYCARLVSTRSTVNPVFIANCGRKAEGHLGPIFKKELVRFIAHEACSPYRFGRPYPLIELF